jgi:hypothetical protein
MFIIIITIIIIIITTAACRGSLTCGWVGCHRGSMNAVLVGVVEAAAAAEVLRPHLLVIIC